MSPGSICAQTTSITPTSGVGDLRTEVSAAGTVHTITGGSRPGGGPNLFHSFDGFNVGIGDTANYPAGVLFGPKASLDVSGSFHASTGSRRSAAKASSMIMVPRGLR
jgi:large exoprotein involved in heme utilization and adhesion